VHDRNLFGEVRRNWATMDDEIRRDIREIRRDLADLRREIGTLVPSCQQSSQSALSEMRRGVSGPLLRHQSFEISAGLEENMVQDCRMHQTCHAFFTDLLLKNASLLRSRSEGDATEQVNANRALLSEQQAKSPFPSCSICFSQAWQIIDHQVDLLRSLRLYRDQPDRTDLEDLDGEILLRDILEPLSNRQRLQILKALSVRERSFSALSEITGLKGGNLLFHLDRLSQSGLILQRHERGDYLISERGYSLLVAVAALPSLVRDWALHEGSRSSEGQDTER